MTADIDLGLLGEKLRLNRIGALEAGEKEWKQSLLAWGFPCNVIEGKGVTIQTVRD